MQQSLSERPYTLLFGVSVAFVAASLTLLSTIITPSEPPPLASSSAPSQSPSSPSAPAMSPLVSVEFEVFGRVQGVFFRKYTQRTARDLGLVGWCLNTRHDTVQGHVQGPAESVARMKRWLSEKGSPQSKIDRVEFHNEHNVAEVVYKEFSVKH